MELFVKAVHLCLDHNGMNMHSLTQGEYGVDYNFSEWTEPTLGGSKLFVYDSVEAALNQYPKYMSVDTVPFRGIALLWGEAVGLERIHPVLRDPKDDMIYDLWTSGIVPGGYVYKKKDYSGILCCDKFMPISFVMKDDLKG